MTGREQSADRGARVGAELRALAEAATPGPWVSLIGVDASLVNVDPSLARNEKWKYGHLGYIATAGSAAHEPDATFIAAANPATILALLDRLEAAEVERDRQYEAAQDLAYTVARVVALADLWAASDVPTDQMRADDIRHALRGALGEQGATSAEETP